MPANGTAALLRRPKDPKTDALAPAAMTPARALRLALARASDQVLGVSASPGALDDQAVTLDGLVEGLEAPALFVLLYGAEGQGGLLSLCPQLLAALIEAQTVGKIGKTPAEPRSPTRTDAIMASVWVDTVLAGLEGLAPALDGAPCIAGMRFGTQAADPPAVGMALTDVIYRRWAVELELGGAKSGRLILALPADPPRPDGALQAGSSWSVDLRRNVLDCEARLDAVLVRLSVNLSQATGLAPGDVLPLDGAELSAVELAGPDGKRVATARLGRMGDRRAVRLVSAPELAPGPEKLAEAAPDPIEAEVMPPEPALTE